MVDKLDNELLSDEKQEEKYTREEEYHRTELLMKQMQQKYKLIIDSKLT